MYFSAAMYDAVMLYAHAATRLLAEGGDLRNGTAVAAAVRSTRFTGVAGTVVALDSSGDRIESYEVMNYVLESSGKMSSVAVGKYDSELQQYQKYERAVVWPGNTSEVPPDFFTGENRMSSLFSL